MRQLVEGLRALHDSGKLHRDIKPSNVLVTGEGRVVLLDFGVATDLRRLESVTVGPADDDVVGTPRYMSPEQAAGESTTAASDLYSVGAMLYEALVGRTPFEGSSFDVLARKAVLSPVAPGACVEGIPPDLDDLCMALLQIDPEARPSSSEVLRALGASSRERSAPPRPVATTLVGRQAEVRALHEAYAEARAGQSITVRVTGETGVGKSALVRCFLEEVFAEGETNVLAGRAYERESVPYKAVDGVIDALSQLLIQLDEDLGDRAPRRRLRALARLFPVLNRVTTIEGYDDDRPSDDSPVAERRRAFGELRECLSSLARRRPLVVLIDDVHCGDADSMALLLEVMRPPRAPPILLLMTSREDSPDNSPLLSEMVASWRGELREVRIKPLAASDALELARTFVEASAPGAERLARAVARESRGYPLLIQELIRSYRHDVGPEGATLVAGTIEKMLEARLGALSARARTLAELVAVAGRPLSLLILAAAAGIEG
ncbi:MAG: protein kinase domain-containing protein, partial [Polyangiaceae bacterium]